MSISHRGLDGQVLEVGVCSGLIDDKHVTIANTFKRTSLTIAVVPCCCRSDVSDGYTLHALTNEADVWSAEV